jgi:tRNA (guanine-N(7)-)-methyltransferase subunit TRM82
MGELLGPNETDDSSLAITDICPSNDGSLVAVAIQRLAWLVGQYISKKVIVFIVF